MGRKEGHLSNKEAQDWLRSRDKNAVQQYKDDLRAVLELPAGRRFLWFHIGNRIVSSSWNGNNGDTAFQEGRRHFAVEMWQHLQDEHPDALKLMIVEAVDAAKTSKLVREAATAAENPEEQDNA